MEKETPGKGGKLEIEGEADSRISKWPTWSKADLSNASSSLARCGPLGAPEVLLQPTSNDENLMEGD